MKNPGSFANPLVDGLFSECGTSLERRFFSSSVFFAFVAGSGMTEIEIPPRRSRALRSWLESFTGPLDAALTDTAGRARILL